MLVTMNRLISFFLIFVVMNIFFYSPWYKHYFMKIHVNSQVKLLGAQSYLFVNASIASTFLKFPLIDCLGNYFIHYVKLHSK